MQKILAQVSTSNFTQSLAKLYPESEARRANLHLKSLLQSQSNLIFNFDFNQCSNSKDCLALTLNSNVNLIEMALKTSSETFLLRHRFSVYN